jgi:formate-dependent nitrite reductase cytochrome c552 subunit
MARALPLLVAVIVGILTAVGGYTFISGVTCSDCHMPYVRVGAMEISGHHVRSPLLNVNNACQTCHKWTEAELKTRAEAMQERVFRLRNRAMEALVAHSTLSIAVRMQEERVWLFAASVCGRRRGCMAR